MGLPKITVVGAGNVGATVSQIILAKGLADVVMVDVAVGVAEGKALDLMHMRGNDCFAGQVIGTGDYAKASGSDIVVVTAGVPRKPGMTREDLLNVNASIVRSVIDGAVTASPEAVFLFVTNPLDVMVNYAYRQAGLPRERLFGMGGVLDTARFVHAVTSRLGCAPGDVSAMVIGAHGEAMLPLPRLATVEGRPLADLMDEAQIAEVIAETVLAGAQVVELLQTGSAFYAPAASIVTMVEELLEPTGRILPVSAGLTGQYGIDGLHLGVPVRLGKGGIAEIIELELDGSELGALQSAAEAIREQLDAL